MGSEKISWGVLWGMMAHFVCGGLGGGMAQCVCVGGGVMALCRRCDLQVGCELATMVSLLIYSHLYYVLNI